MTRPTQPIRTTMGWSKPDKIVVKGRDITTDIIGKLNLGDMAFLEMTSRLPSPQESIMFNAVAVTLVEHGITPSALAARMTYMGAPEGIQGAVAAGLLGLGSVFVGTTEGSARLLQEALPDPKANVDLKELAKTTVAAYHKRGGIIPGIGHPVHKPIDPRTPRLFQIAKETGFHGRYVELMQLVAQEAERVYGKQLPINATGAIGAVCSEMGFSWKVCRGIGVFARAVGLVGHIVEEMNNPISREVWFRTEDEATANALADLAKQK